MATDIKSLTVKLGEAGKKLDTIKTNLGAVVTNGGNTTNTTNTNQKGGLWDWAKGVLEWGGWSDLVNLYKEFVNAGIIKPAYEPPEKMTEADIRRIIAEAIAAQEKPLWQKVLPYAGIATLGTIVTILLLKRK